VLCSIPQAETKNFMAIKERPIRDADITAIYEPIV
jgi:hypothetical protein